MLYRSWKIPRRQSCKRAKGRLRHMKKNLSFFGMFALGFGSIVGVGWSSALNNLFKLGGGPVAASVSFALATLLFVPIALSIQYLAQNIPMSGGVSAYALQNFGPSIAFLGGWFLTLSYMAILPFEAIVATDMIGYLLPGLRKQTPLYTILGENVYLSAAGVGFLFAALIATVNWRGIQAGVKFQKVMTVVLLTSTGICILFALLRANATHLLSPIYAPVEGYTHKSFSAGIFSLLSVAPQYFAGFDTIQQNAELGSRKHLGKAVIGALLSAGAFYIVIFLATGLAYPWQETASLPRPVLANVFLMLYSGMFGKVLWYLCMIATMAGLLGAWNGFFIASVKSMQGMANLGLLPSVFGKAIKKEGMPLLPFLLCLLLIAVGIFLGAGVLDIVCRLSSVGFVVAWAISCCCAYQMEWRQKQLISERGRRRSKIHTVALLSCFCILINSIFPGMPGYIGIAGIIFLIGWASVGLGFYMLSSRNKIWGENQKQKFSI